MLVGGTNASGWSGVNAHTPPSYITRCVGWADDIHTPTRIIYVDEMNAEHVSIPNNVWWHNMDTEEAPIGSMCEGII